MCSRTTKSTKPRSRCKSKSSRQSVRSSSKPKKPNGSKDRHSLRPASRHKPQHWESRGVQITPARCVVSQQVLAAVLLGEIRRAGTHIAFCSCSIEIEPSKTGIDLVPRSAAFCIEGTWCEHQGKGTQKDLSGQRTGTGRSPSVRFVSGWKWRRRNIQMRTTSQ